MRGPKGMLFSQAGIYSLQASICPPMLTHKLFLLFSSFVAGVCPFSPNRMAVTLASVPAPLRCQGEAGAHMLSASYSRSLGRLIKGSQDLQAQVCNGCW
jgi:hypothetical protein